MTHFPSKRGRKVTHWAEVARVDAWYGQVIARKPRTNAELDRLFAWRDGKYAERVPGERPKTFERIENSSRKAQGRDPRWRSFEEILEVVDQHPDYNGTRRVCDAEIWDLIQAESTTPEILSIRIDRLLAKRDLVRVPVTHAFLDSGSILARYGDLSLIYRSLLLSLEYLDHLDALALVWTLFQEAESVVNHDVRAQLLPIADEYLDLFFLSYLPEHHFIYYGMALTALQKHTIDLSGREMMGYGKLETLPRYAILPRELVGQLTFGEARDQWLTLKR